MKALVHYQNILNSLFRFGNRQSLEHMDRLWENLQTSGLDTYISRRGLDTIWREVSSQSGVDVANRVKASIEGALGICPLANLQQVRDFAHRHGGNSYEEALEIYSASSISAECIISSSPQSFSPFHLTEISLSQNPDLSFLQDYRVPNSLPILLVGDLSSIWFLVNSLELKRNSTPVNLKQWFQGDRFEHGWYSIEELNIESCVKPASRSRNVRRGKLITLGRSNQKRLESVALIVAVSNPLKEFNVTIELVSGKSGAILPNFLRLEILDADGMCVEQDTANHKSAIVMEIEGEESEPFSVQIRYNGFVHQERFSL
jgi:hypothetical protein